ncbi:MAG: hypothetical protein BWY06_02533 [Candidatus Latescibacteria bacterium ADurb.Bin168]|nr:MAG: hypothetical protein BWY06_02533 [Candidatus Latescibacteria bacterium ADurb.Bin168]
MFPVGRKVGFREKFVEHGEARLPVTRPGLGVSAIRKPFPQSQQSLNGDCGGRAVHRFAVVERVRRTVEIVPQRGKTGRARVPVRNSVSGAVLAVKVACSLRRSPHHRLDTCPASQRLQFAVWNRSQEFQFLREAKHHPCQPSRPRAERGIALLAVRAAVHPVVDVEYALVCHSPAHVICVAALPVENGITGRGFCVSNHSLQQRYPPVLFFQKNVPEPVRQ